MVRELLKKSPFAEHAYRLLKKFRSEKENNLANKEFKRQFEQFVSLSDPNRFKIRWADRYPILNEKTAQTSFDRHYIYHTAWAARCLAETKPAKHIDISSLLFFSAITSAFVPIDFYDFRPADIVLNNLTSKSANLTKLHFENNSIPSLSCMHTVEHIGLGRYGDEIDPNGDRKAMSELERVLAPGGNLFFVVPVGKDLLRFNAHRIYSYDQIVNTFTGLTLKSFSLITENFADGGLMNNPAKELTDSQDYGCGCFWFTK
jgi:SAM-dependent methyltransferase